MKILFVKWEVPLTERIWKGRHMNIALDIDGVLTDFEWFITTYGKKYFSKHGYQTDVTKASSSVSERFGYSKEWDKKFYTQYLFWYAIKYPIRENAAEVIHTLRHQGNKIYLITARALADRKTALGMLMRHCLLKWLKKNLVEYDDIYFVSTYDSAEEKCRLCKMLKIDIIVEDDPLNIEKLEKICKVVCMAADYNQEVISCSRVIDFGEVYWSIQQKEPLFTPLDYKIREQLNPTQRIEYFDKLKNYYLETPFDSDYLKKHQRNIQKVLKILGGVFRLLFPLEIVDGKISAPCYGTIFVCNHRSALDVPMCYCVLNNVQARVLTKREFEASPLGNFMHFLGIIFLNRADKKSGKAMQNLMIQTVLNKGNILLFPEGTRNYTSKKLLPFKMGATYMAQVTGAPIVPIAIYKKKGKYKISIGKEIRIGVLDDLEEMNRCLMNTVRNLLEGLES